MESFRRNEGRMLWGRPVDGSYVCQHATLGVKIMVWLIDSACAEGEMSDSVADINQGNNTERAFEYIVVVLTGLLY